MLIGISVCKSRSFFVLSKFTAIERLFFRVFFFSYMN